MTIESGYDPNGKKYYRSSKGGPTYYVYIYGEANARELARRAERSVIGRTYDFGSNNWASKME